LTAIPATSTSTPRPPPRDTFTPSPTLTVIVGCHCPSGCTSHEPGADIKGNIAFGSGEKIYHVPGGEFYNQTVINPDFGERWFCTEEEARNNGLRKSQR
jgi:hypothetical protein